VDDPVEPVDPVVVVVEVVVDEVVVDEVVDGETTFVDCCPCPVYVAD
jgi:hypothetical protein